MSYVNTTTVPSRKPRSADGSMRFGLFWPKAKTMLPSAMMAERNPDPLDLENHMELARGCEEVGLDFILLGDGYAPSSDEGSLIGFQDPSMHAIILAAPIIMATRHMGVITTMHTPFMPPAQIARFGSHLDWLSGGRWGWNIVNGYRDYESSLFGIDALPDGTTQYDACEEALTIIDAIWREGRVDFSGKHYRARGKMRGPFPPERPALVCAAASERGRRFTAQHCDFLFASPPSLADLPSVQAELDRYAAEAGRPHAPRILVVADLLIRDEPGEGSALMEELMGSMVGEAGRRWMGQMARLRRTEGSPGVFPAFAGTPSEVADQIVSAHERWGLRGVLFRLPLWSAEEMRRVGPVFDLLAKAGIWTPPATRGHAW
jgi:dimethylsulfone monooxygenase